jgi:L-ascorbate metabolism protein UlaG (beta-lactamase superfamily)
MMAAIDARTSSARAPGVHARRPHAEPAPRQGAPSASAARGHGAEPGAVAILAAMRRKDQDLGVAAAEPKDPTRSARADAPAQRRPTADRDAVPRSIYDQEVSAPRNAAELLASVGDDLETAIERSLEAAFAEPSAPGGPRAAGAEPHRAPGPTAELERLKRDTIPTVALDAAALEAAPAAADAATVGATPDPGEPATPRAIDGEASVPIAVEFEPGDDADGGAELDAADGGARDLVGDAERAPDGHAGADRAYPIGARLRAATALEPDDPEGRERALIEENRQHRNRRHRSLVVAWARQWLRRARRPAVEPLPDVAPGQVGITFAGHATVLIRFAELTIVCDPMLGRWVHAAKRAVAPGLAAADLHDVDLVLISHAHRDHLHRPTLARLPRSATIVVPPQTAQLVSDLGFARVIELNVDQSFTQRGVDVATAAVRHGGGREPRALSFFVRGDGPSVYFCGDSGYFSGFAEVGRRFRPDIALLPIGGYLPRAMRDRHMSPLDALYAFEDLRARVWIPIHYGSFALSYEQLDEPARWLRDLTRERDLDRYVVPLPAGGSRVFTLPH